MQAAKAAIERPGAKLEGIEFSFLFVEKRPLCAVQPAAESGAAIFYDWAFEFPFDAISELPSTQWASSPVGVFGQLSAPSDPSDLGSQDPSYSNALNANLDFLAGYAANRGWAPSISSNLPNIPVNDMSLDPDLPGTIYVATDIGVFVTANTGATSAKSLTGHTAAATDSNTPNS